MNDVLYRYYVLLRKICENKSPDSVLVSRVNINGEAEETTVTLLSGPVHGSGQYLGWSDTAQVSVVSSVSWSAPTFTDTLQGDDQE